MSEMTALAELAGIQRSYTDIWGKEHFVEEETLIALLGALGFPSANGEERAASQEKLLRLRQRDVAPYVVVPAGKRTTLSVPQAMTWQLIHEDGRTEKGEACREKIVLPPLQAGYYELHIDARKLSHRTAVLAAPGRCWVPAAIEDGKRTWGVAAQLYALRSKRNWGIGDFTDLKELAVKCASYGADVIGLNPLHAMFPSRGEHISPYSPSSRLFTNILYLDMEAVPGYSGLPAELKQALSGLRETEHVDYTGVTEIKRRMLETLFMHFAEDAAFDQYFSEQGEPLKRQAEFDALSETYGDDWTTWPQDAQAKPERIRFFLWTQWLADTQLGQAHRAAKKKGMLVGLYRDLAVGPDKTGAEVWQHPETYLTKASVGAPPDLYNQRGQNWGLPAFDPFALAAEGFKPFIALVRANMRHAGALRIDHAFGLSRLYLIPDGMEATHGAYLTYPFDALLAVLKIESHRNQCIVIGEDLGTFPPGFKEQAEAAGLFSYKLLYFEKEGDDFTPSVRYPMRALATISTHDLPTWESWTQGLDIEERAKFGFYPDEELHQKDLKERPKDKAALAKALGREGLDGLNVENAQRFLSRSPAAMVMMQLEDILRLTTQANLPSTTTERPNWRIKLPVELGEMLRPGGPLHAMASLMNEERERPLLEAPRATYRLQFHKDFTFYDAAKIIPYLASLGISHIYASPYLQARPGSTHGYDITDHSRFNGELGSEEGFSAFTAALEAHGMKHILDFVPNHMSAGQDNHWWMEVLEWGENAPHALFFDIDWRAEHGEKKVILPVLGSAYGDVLAKEELKLAFDPASGGIYLTYYDNRFPICPRDYTLIHPSFGEAATHAEGEALKAELKAQGEPVLKPKIEAMNEDIEALHELLERQHYRLTFWRVAATDINYRRFFDINELVGMRVERQEVFDAMHAHVFSLIDQGKLHGLRIDHIDGLADPAAYCRRLRARGGSGFYLTVEKILGADEMLPRGWETQGTSGYDMLNVIGGVFVDPRSEPALSGFYHRFAQVHEPLDDILYQAKQTVLSSSFASELHSISLMLKHLADRDRYTRDYPFELLKSCLKELISRFSIYRTYVSPGFASGDDQARIERAVRRAKRHSQLPDDSVYDFIASLLMADDAETDADALDFIREFQQLSGPVMAKGTEDTAFYRYYRLLPLNEVGSDPMRFGLGIQAFHARVKAQQEAFPHTMLATATHDTKRGEDARMRLSVLSEMPKEWRQWVLQAARLTRPHRRVLERFSAPSHNEEYFLYQTLLGGWPVEMLETPSGEAISAYGERVKTYLTKALREGKQHSSWTHPREDYEKAVHDFTDAILRDETFIRHLLPMAQLLARAGAINSLSQLTLKLTLPGVPDIYQGTEYWDLSFVDPDNRRPVDYSLRQKQLGQEPDLPALLEHWQDARVKQRLMQALLRHRKEYPGLYAHGMYKPLRVTGKYAKQVLAFERIHESQSLTVVVPVRAARISDGFPLGEAWEDTALQPSPRSTMRSLITGEPVAELRLSHILRRFPIAVIESR